MKTGGLLGATHFATVSLFRALKRVFGSDPAGAPLIHDIGAPLMSTFSFSAVVGTAVIAELLPMQSTSLEQAKQEGRLILARLAMEHVPTGEDMLSVELFNGTGEPLAELRLSYQVIEKQPAAIAMVD